MAACMARVIFAGGILKRVCTLEAHGFTCMSLGEIECIEGVQQVPPHNVPLWYMNYFKLKALEKQQMPRDFL